MNAFHLWRTLRSAAFALGCHRELKALDVVMKATRFYPTPATIGKEGESEVVSVLTDLPEVFISLHGCVFRSKHDPGSSAQADHLVVSPAGIVVLETKNLSGFILGKETDPFWQQVVGWNRYPFKNPLRQNQWHIKVRRDYLPSEKFYSLVVFGGNRPLGVHAAGVIEADQLGTSMMDFARGPLRDAQRRSLAGKIFRLKSVYGSMLPSQRRSPDDAVAVCTELANAQVWIQEAAKHSDLRDELSPKGIGWLAMVTEGLDAPYAQFGLHSQLIETYSLEGENLEGTQPC